jgi:DNA-binding transcriptional regulator YhcF (GntR family)
MEKERTLAREGRAPVFVIVDWEDRRPAYVQVRDQIVEHLARGELTPGTVLPSVRRLAGELGLNLHTVHKAFELLRDQGFIQLRQGTGAVARPTPTPEVSSRVTQELGPLLAEAWVKGMTRDEILQAVAGVLDTYRAPSASDRSPGAVGTAQGGG